MESFLGSSTSNFLTHQLTKGEYDERIARLQREHNYIIKLLEKLVGEQKPKQHENKGMSVLKTNSPKTGMPTIAETQFPNEPMM